MKKVAIVGSGISGLACAVALKEEGVDFMVLEKGPAAGGKLLTEKADGFSIEAGPDSFLSEKPWTLDLIRKVGLEDRLLATNEEHKGTYIYSRGRLHRLPEGVMLMVPTMLMPLVRSRLISLPGKVRMGLEAFIPRKRADSDESLASFVARRLGRECLEKIAEPLVAGIHTADPENMSVKAVFPRFLEMEKESGSLVRAMARAVKKAPVRGDAHLTYFMSLREGMQQLVDGCVDFVGKERVRTSCEVARVRKTAQGYELAAGPSGWSSTRSFSPPLPMRRNACSEARRSRSPTCFLPLCGPPRRPFHSLSPNRPRPGPCRVSASSSPAWKAEGSTQPPGAR